MKCPLCNDTGLLFAFTDQGVTPPCSCPVKSTRQVSLAASAPRSIAELQHQAALPARSEASAVQAQ